MHKTIVLAPTSLEPLLIPTSTGGGGRERRGDPDRESTSSTSSADELDRDESTLANISTLRDEEYSKTTSSVARPPGGAASVIISDSSSTDGSGDGGDDDDEGNKTLRDISGIEDLTIDEGIDDLIEAQRGSLLNLAGFLYL